jgi:hypothetical protein
LDSESWVKVASLPGMRTLVDVRRASSAIRPRKEWQGVPVAGALGTGLAFGPRSCGQITHVEPHCAACREILRSADVQVEPDPGPRPRATTEIPQRRSRKLATPADRVAKGPSFSR